MVFTSFIGKRVIPKAHSTGSRGARKVKVVLCEDKWYIVIKGICYYIMNSDKLKGCSTIYSKPSNDKHDVWTMRKLQTPVREEKELILLQSWSKYRPDSELNYKDLQIDHVDRKIYILNE